MGKECIKIDRTVGKFGKIRVEDDGRYMEISQNLIPNSGLNALFSTLQSPPFLSAQVEIAEGFQRYHHGTTFDHEAGYDALITGHCFATMVNYLGKLKSPTVEFTLPLTDIVEPFVNKIFFEEKGDITCLNLGEPEMKVDREPVLHVTCPKDYGSEKLKELFQSYGKVEISWLTEPTALVALCNKQNYALALEKLSQQSSDVQVISYNAYQHKSRTSLCAGSSSSSSFPSMPKRNFKFMEHDDNDDVPPNKVQRHSTYQFKAEGEMSFYSGQDDEGDSEDSEDDEAENTEVSETQ